MRRGSLRRSIERLLKPAIEGVESRILLSTFTVTNTKDDGSSGSLRWAIEQSNASAGPNTINFDISASTGVQTIVLTSALPAVTVPVTIDGTSEPGYDTTPLIELDGENAGKVAGFDLQAGHSTVKGLAINRFGAQGIILEHAGNNTIEDNFIGTDPTGTIAEGNGSDGVIVDVNSHFNVIRNNLISGNAGNGVYLNGDLFGATNPTTTGNVIIGNFIGTDVTGTKVLGNVKDGLYVHDAPETRIGGPTAEERNIISGNGNGMELYEHSDNSVIMGNYIGTDVTGTVALANGPSGAVLGDGIVLKGISNSVIGGTAPGEGNVISGNLNKGIDSFVIGSGNLVIEGNFIGTDATGTRPLGNGSDGILIAGESNVTIGGTVPGAGNVISANNGDGINTFAGNPGLVIQGNFIGTDVNGVNPLGNGGDGVHATFADITIGGLAIGAGNVIANNGYKAAFDHSGIVATNNDITILSNSIYNNASLGIELAGNANHALPAPVLSEAAATSTGSTISGTIPVAAGVYTLQFFATPGLNAAGHAEGRTFLGTLSVTSSGNPASFTATLPATFPAGSLITATLTNAAGDTSQFSLPFTGTGTGTGLGAPTIVGSSSPASVYAGQTITNTFFISNPDVADDLGVLFSNAIPAGTTFVSGTTSIGVPVVLSNGVATANIGVLQAGETVRVTLILATSNVSAPSFVNTAYVSSTTPSVAPATDGASITNNVKPATDLSVTIDAPTAPVQAGQQIKYVVTVTNNGPSDATGVVLTDTLPNNVSSISFEASSGSGSIKDGILTQDFGNLASGASATLTIFVATDGDSVPSVTDSASVTGDETDRNSGNNASSATTTVVSAADLAVAIRGPASSTPVGQNLTYVVTVTNHGPSAATGVILTNTLPSGVTFIAATPSTGPAASETNGVVTDDFGSLAPGASATLTIIVSPTTGAVPSVTDHAAVSANEADPSSSNNTAAFSSGVTPSANLAVVITPSAATVGVGSTLSYKVTVTNVGPSDATGVVLTDILPANVSDVSATASAGEAPLVSGGVVSDTIDRLAAGSSVVITINITPTAAAPPSISDSVSVSGNEFDADASNNTAVAATTVTPVSDLGITLNGPSGNIFADGDLTYTAVITNHGPSAATNVQFTAPLFPGTRFVSVTSNQASGTDDNGVATLTLGTLDVGASATVTLIVIPSHAGMVSNTAHVTGADLDPNGANNTASTVTSVISPTSLIAFSASSYTVNENAGYATITIDRLTGTDNDVTVHFATTSGGRATAGVDYRSTDATIHFPRGAVQATVKVPVLANPFDNQDETVILRLDNPTGDGILQAGEPGGRAPIYATLMIKDLDPVKVGPTVTDLTLSGPAHSITSITISISGDLDPATADNTANYTITALGGARRHGVPTGTVVPVKSATYSAATHTITLTPQVPLRGNTLFQIDVNGTRPGALSDRVGNPLNSVLGTKPGSNFTLTVERGTRIAYTDENGAHVTLNLNGPGTLDIDREPSGRVERLQVVGAVPRKTVISGAVPTRRSTTIGSILGLGHFGSIRLKLRTPPFSILNAVYPNPESLMNAPATDTLTAAATGNPRLRVKARVVAAHPRAGAAELIRNRFRP